MFALVTVLAGTLALPVRASVADAAVWAALLRYEAYLQSIEDPTYGYECTTGYPMYLQTIAETYLGLYEYTREARYRERFLYVVGVIKRQGEPKGYRWSLHSFSCQAEKTERSIYNALFAPVFVKAWQLTGKSEYQLAARASLAPLLTPAGVDIYEANDWVVLAQTAIAEYVAATGDRDAALIGLGERLGAFSLDHYDPGTGRWYFNLTYRDSGYYEQISAYYQMVSMLAVLRAHAARAAVFPEQERRLERELPRMLDAIKPYIRAEGSMNYSQYRPNQTEAAAQVLWLLTLFDQHFRADHRNLRATARQTVLSRQAPNGGFYPSATYRLVEVWYQDAVAWALVHTLDVQPALARIYLPQVRR